MMPAPEGRLVRTGQTLLSMICLLGYTSSGLPADEPVLPQLSKKSYLLDLNLHEFSVLTAAEVDGLMKYGGTGDFKLTMAKEGEAIKWKITIDNPRLIEVLGIYIGEKAVGLMNEFSRQDVDADGKIVMQAIASLGQKVDFSQKNPVWSEVNVRGTVVKQGENLTIQTADGNLNVAGPNANVISKWADREVIADGYAKAPGQFEPIRVIEKRTHTLELFVMSLCPYGQRAAMNLLDHLGNQDQAEHPKLEVHYIFYKRQKDGKDTFTSLHGDKEITENLVQIVLRDRYPALFEAYLRQRASSGELPWRLVMEQFGVDQPIMDEIESIITKERDALIQAEYDYVTGRYNITDGSPSYVWESERVMDLGKIPQFKAMFDFAGKAGEK